MYDVLSRKHSEDSLENCFCSVVPDLYILLSNVKCTVPIVGDNQERLAENDKHK